jgi:hypothetical protein
LAYINKLISEHEAGILLGFIQTMPDYYDEDIKNYIINNIIINHKDKNEQLDDRYNCLSNNFLLRNASNS